MNKIKSKSLSIFLAFVMLCTFVPTVNLTADAAVIAGFEASGDTAYYNMHNQGIFTVRAFEDPVNQTNPIRHFAKGCFVGDKAWGITFSDGHLSLRDYSITDSDFLINVTISSTINLIGEGVFSNCRSLQNIIVVSNNPHFSSVGGVLYNKNRTKLIKYPEGKKGKSFIIPSTVTEIGKGAFSRLRILENLTIPASVKTIANDAFDDFGSIRNINVNSKNNNFSSVSGVLFNKTKRNLIKYPAGKTATKYTVPKNVTTIGSYAFYENSKIKEVTLPSSARTIDDYAFVRCTSLVRLSIPKGVKTIRPAAFLAPNKNLFIRTSRNSTAHKLATSRGWNVILTNVKRRITFRNGKRTAKRYNIEHNELLTAKQRNYKIKKKGFKFGGWYADSKFKRKFNFKQRITKNHTVYAKFTKNKK